MSLKNSPPIQTETVILILLPKRLVLFSKAISFILHLERMKQIVLTIVMICIFLLKFFNFVNKI